jgi:AcrR family transcriptional regulator
MYESQIKIHNGGGVPDQKPTPDRVSGVRDREPAPDSEPAPGRERAPGREPAPESEPTRRGERSSPGRERGVPGRERGTPGRQRRDTIAASLDDLWPPFSAPWSDRDARTHRKLHQRAEEQGQLRNPRGRGANRLAPSLSRAEIVDTAIAVADAEGADAVSMRRIAQVLKSGTMSLYWHVANKEHLLNLMLDALTAEARVPEPSGDWRADLQNVAREYRAMLLRHRWVMDFVGGRPPLGPNTMLNLDRSLAMLDGLGVGTVLAFNILETVSTYVLGATLREVREMRVQDEQEQSGISQEEWEPIRDAWRDRLEADGRFTHIVRFLDENFDPDAEETRDERFEFGLDCVLDGIGAKIADISRCPPA